MRKNQSQRGMSLLEMSAASIAVAVALLGTTAAVISGASLSAEVTRMRAATRAASAIMEDVRATDFALLVDTWNENTVTVGAHETGMDDGTATLSVVQVDNGSTTQILYQVTVTVSFEGAGGAQTYPIVTYVSDRVAGNSLSSSSTVPTGETQTEETTPTETTGTTEGTETTDPGGTWEPL
jgi:prepilin-type N-terminal cleavage/methylation domain-containing protein